MCDGERSVSTCVKIMRLFGFQQKAGAAWLKDAQYECHVLTLRTPDMDIVGGSRIMAVWHDHLGFMEFLTSSLPPGVKELMTSWATRTQAASYRHADSVSPQGRGSLLEAMKKDKIEFHDTRVYVVAMSEADAAKVAYDAGLRTYEKSQILSMGGWFQLCKYQNSGVD